MLSTNRCSLSLLFPALCVVQVDSEDSLRSLTLNLGCTTTLQMAYHSSLVAPDSLALMISASSASDEADVMLWDGADALKRLGDFGQPEMVGRKRSG